MRDDIEELLICITVGSAIAAVILGTLWYFVFYKPEPTPQSTSEIGIPDRYLLAPKPTGRPDQWMNLPDTNVLVPDPEPLSTATICGDLILNIIEQGDTLYTSDIFEDWIEDKLDDPRYPQHRILACVVDLIMVLPWLAPQGERHPL